MPNVVMLDTTATIDDGSLKKGEVYEVSSETAERLVKSGVAKTTKAQTSAARQKELEESDEPEDADDDEDAEEEETPAKVEENTGPKPINKPITGPPQAPSTPQNPATARPTPQQTTNPPAKPAE